VVPHTEDAIAAPENESSTEVTTSPTAEPKPIAVQPPENNVTAVENDPVKPPVARLDVRAALKNSKFARRTTERAAPPPSASTRPIRSAGHYIQRFSPYQRARRYRSQLISFNHAQWITRGERRMNSDVMRGYPLLRDTLLQPSKASEADVIIKMFRH
jgi:hypothetical protein